MKTILVFSNHPSWTYNLRGEVLQALVNEGYKVVVAVGYGPEVEKLKEIGCEFVDVPFNRHGTNPIVNLYNKTKSLRKLPKPEKPRSLYR